METLRKIFNNMHCKYQGVDDTGKVISEPDKLWRWITKHFVPKNSNRLETQVKQLLADIEEMNLLFEMQNKRMREADKYWQKLTGKKNTYPDLGQLLFFLMDRIKELESKQSV